MVDDMTRKSWSKFGKSKLEMPKIVEEQIECLKGQGHPVKYIRYELFYGKKPSFVRFMVEFGRIRYVTRRDVKMKGKLAERAIKCIMVGYARNYAGDVYHLYNPSTKRILLSHDVTWGDWKPVDPRSNMDAFVQYEPTETVQIGRAHV